MDNTQTGLGRIGPTPDGMSGIAEQLLTLAHTGLLPSAIVERQQTKGGLGLLLDMSSPGSQLVAQAESLISYVCQACDKLGGGPLGNSGRKLFGTAPGEREFPYSRRHAGAADAWDPDIKVESYDRRHRKIVLAEIEHQLLTLTTSTARSELLVSLGKLPLADPTEVRPNLGFRRLEFRAHTYIVGDDPHPVYTDWHYVDVVARDGEQDFRIFTHMDGNVTIESLSDFVTVQRPLGVNPYGYQVWLLRFSRPLQRGEQIEWGVRKHFHDVTGPDGHDWLSLAASQPRAIESGSFSVDLTLSTLLPKRFVRFIVPKGNLPNLRGPTWDIPIPKSRIVTATFDYLHPWHSHGIFWWWYLH